MNMKHNKKRLEWRKRSSTIHYSLFTIHSPRGISLMEVLASVFVIGVGLLGVLAVIPFGVYQVSKANHADYCSNMLRNAEHEIRVRELAKLHTWIEPPTSNQIFYLAPSTYRLNPNGATVPITGPTYFMNDRVVGDRRYRFDCYLLVDPFFVPGMRDVDIEPAVGMTTIQGRHVLTVGRADHAFLSFVSMDNIPLWQELMRGQDDLLYNTYEDQRTDFSNTNNRPTSSGQYTWFFMFRPEPINAATQHDGWCYTIPTNIEDTAPVDVLACYNRVPGEARTVFARIHSTNAVDNDYEATLRGARITFRSQDAASLDLSKTKYIFVSWVKEWAASGPMYHVEGRWCRIVNSTPVIPVTSQVTAPDLGASTLINVNYERTVFVVDETGALPNSPSGFPTPGGAPANIALRGLIVPGVLYHKRIDGVPIK